MLAWEIETGLEKKSLIDSIHLPEWKRNSIYVDLLRLDKIHPVVSGNKWFKLKYHLERAKNQNATRIITWGGAYSNHIVASAYASNEMGLPSVGIIRGEEPSNLSHTLEQAKNYGMLLKFVSRKSYKKRAVKDELEERLREYPGSYIIAEGGAGEEGIKGAKEILKLVDSKDYSHVFCAVGTGTMFLGLASGLESHQSIIGISVLKGIDGDLLLNNHGPGILAGPSRKLIPDYHFGGYAKRNSELFRFMNDFYARTAIPLDFVYTGKLMYAVFDLADKGYFPENSRILVIHSGGLQGNQSLQKGILSF